MAIPGPDVPQDELDLQLMKSLFKACYEQVDNWCEKPDPRFDDPNLPEAYRTNVQITRRKVRHLIAEHLHKNREMHLVSASQGFPVSDNGTKEERIKKVKHQAAQSIEAIQDAMNMQVEAIMADRVQANVNTSCLNCSICLYNYYMDHNIASYNNCINCPCM